MQNPRSSRDRAFTLVELMAAMVVMALLGSIAVSRSRRGENDTAVTGLTRQLSAAVQQARFTARSTGRQVRLTFNRQNPAAQLRLAPVLGDSPIDDVTWAAQPPQFEISANPGALVLDVQSGATLGGALPAGMMGGPVNLTFLSSGRVRYGASANYGATLFIADQTLKRVNRLLVFGRTGFPKVITQ